MPEAGATGQKLITLDDEITQGATMKLTYQITIENTGSYHNSYIINDYIDNSLGFSKEENEKNKEWNIVDITTADFSDDIKNGTKTVVQATTEDGEAPLEITLTKVLSQEDDGRYENWCEIASYSNDEGRRIYATTPANCNSDPFTRGQDEPNENDTAKAEVVGVVPPFGMDSSHTIEKISTSLMIGITLSAIVIVKIKERKNKEI